MTIDLALLGFSIVLAAPVERGYEGVTGVRAPEGEASQALELPADEDGQDAPQAEDGESISLDDVFGTAEDHEDVEVLPADGAAAAPAEASAQGSSSTTTTVAAPAVRRFWNKLDTRVRILSSVYYDVDRVEERGFGRNENRLEFYFAYTPNKHLQIVGDVEAVFFGVAQARELDDLATQQLLTPFHFESDAAYIGLFDILPNLDIKIGRQILVWGTADKFNPTNNINPDDLEDRPLFTEPIANQMVVVDYAPLADKLWFQGVYVPLFYPALLPPSAAAALKDPQTIPPFADESDKDQIRALQDTLDINPGLIPTVRGTVDMPPRRFIDGQAAFKVGTSLGGVDMSASYYVGRHDIPTPAYVESTDKELEPGAPTDEAECCFESNARLVYPRMQVVGLDFATQLPFLGNMGLWGEGALFFPEEQDLFIELPVMVDVTPDDGEVNPVESVSGPSIRKTPFVKATAGLDYTFGKHVYVQAQYIRGFINEFGVDHIGNFLSAGTDLIFFGRHLVARLFGVVEFPRERGGDASGVIFPALLVTPPWGSVNFEVGSFVLLGKKETFFGQKASGSSIAFFRVTGTF